MFIVFIQIIFSQYFKGFQIFLRLYNFVLSNIIIENKALVQFLTTQHENEIELSTKRSPVVSTKYVHLPKAVCQLAHPNGFLVGKSKEGM